MGAEEDNKQNFAMQFPMMPAGNGQQQMFYIPQPGQFVPMPINEDTESLVQKNEDCQRRGWGGCRRWRGCKREGNVCWKDDGRPLGTFQNFVVSVFFGTIAPLLSIIMTFGMETSKLSRLGVFFGTANSFFLLSTGLVAWMVKVKHHSSTVHLIVPTIIGLIFLVIALKSFRRFLYFYRTRETKAEEEKVRVISQAGSCCEFAVTFFVSLVLPVFGAFISIIVRRNSLYGRYGALSGFGLGLIIFGVAASFHGMYPVLLAVGLFIMEFSLVHFRRALICVETTHTSVTPA